MSPASARQSVPWSDSLAATVRAPSDERRRASRRRGFTLAELIVGMVLLTIGVGALAGTAAYVFYETAASRRAERAAVVARTRFELLRLGQCVSATGVQLHDGLTERWTISATRHSAVALVSITYRERNRLLAQRYDGAFPC